MAISLTVEKTSGRARAGLLTTPHGMVRTPFFMVVGTAASVKGMTIQQLHNEKAQVLLANTYHLAVRPGEELIRQKGGVAKFMGWAGPTLTDSGGYQVFSLTKKRILSEEGVRFCNHIDGRELFLTPERAVAIQEALGADIMMCLDECPPAKAERADIIKSLALTHNWAKRCLGAWKNRERQALFGIVQGALFEDLRKQSVDYLTDLDFPGYAVGGVAVGESPEDINRIVSYTTPLLPFAKPRYLMGVGRPQDIIRAVGAGIDMFDCVMPTRHARHAQAFSKDGTLNLKNARYAEDDKPLEPDCDCETCRTVSRAYIRHLCQLDEIMASVWLTIHNVRFYLRLLENIRSAILNDSYPAFMQENLARLEGGNKQI